MTEQIPTFENPVVRDLGDRYGIFVDAGEEPAGFTLYVPYTDRAGRTQRIFPHTVVKEEFGGHGLASVLVQHALDDSIAQGFAIVAVCPYVQSWLGKHAGYEEHLVPATPQHLAAVQEALRH